MNGTAGWKIAHRPDGRPYWYKGTETTWIKPEELYTPQQRASGWKETNVPEAPFKSYWFRKDDNSKTQWEPPAEWQDAAPELP